MYPMSQGYYCCHEGSYPYPSCYCEHQQHYIIDNNNNYVERNPYPFDGSCFDARLRRPYYPYYYHNSRNDGIQGRVDPYASYGTHYFESPLLAYPQPLPPPHKHPFHDLESMCTIM
ncbi:hypothetical protein AAHE18_06G072900 [Arachis hypogaea]